MGNVGSFRRSLPIGNWLLNIATQCLFFCQFLALFEKIILGRFNFVGMYEGIQKEKLDLSK
jgi:hypothetical protein